MPGSGICIVMPFRIGYKFSGRYSTTRSIFIALQKMLVGRHASGFDVCDLTELAYRCSLTASSPEVRMGKCKNAPYHSFIYPYWGWFSELDKGEHVLQSGVNMPAQWAMDLASSVDVHHYIWGYVDPNDVHQIWPDGSDAPGIGPGSGGVTIPTTGYCEEFTCSIAGKTATVWHGGDKTIIADPPATVTPILTNNSGHIASWTYKNKWHYWNANSMQPKNTLTYLGWYGFVLWTLAHITKVRSHKLTVNTMPVMIDVDDVCRKTTTAWYSKLEADPQCIRRFGTACKVNGFGPPRIATEAVAASIAGSPNLVASLAAISKQNLIRVHPHSHDVPYGAIKDPRDIKSELEAVDMLDQSWASLESVGIRVDKRYISMPANVINEDVTRGAFLRGIKLIRGGDWVSSATKSEQPMHIGAARGRGPYAPIPGFLYRTGHYGGLLVDVGNNRYTWSTLGAKYAMQENQVKSNQLTSFFREILLGSDRIDINGFASQSHIQPCAHYVFHPNAVTDDDLGIDMVNWMGEWNAVFPFYCGIDDPQKFACWGS